MLVRPNLRKLHGFPIAAVETVLTDIGQHAVVLTPVFVLRAFDPGDQLLWDLLATMPDVRLITGDKLFPRDIGMHTRVISAADFVAGR